MRRLFLILVLIMTVLWIHPMLALLMSVVFAFLQDGDYYELVAVGVLIDILYQSLIELGFISLPIYTLIGLVLFFAVQFLKKQMNFYA